MTKKDMHHGFNKGDRVIVIDYDGNESEPVTIVSTWGDIGQATVEPAAHGCRFWNTETMRAA